MRDLKELYQILLDKYDEIHLFYGNYIGICTTIEWLNWEFINDEEYKLLKRDFQLRRPKAFSKFWWNFSFNKNTNNVWWWDKNKSGNKQRKLFIKHIIDSL